MAKVLNPNVKKPDDITELNMNSIADALMGANHADSWIHDEFRAMGIRPFGHMPVEGMVIPVKGDRGFTYEIKVGSVAWQMLKAGYQVKDIVRQIQPTQQYVEAWNEYRQPYREQIRADRLAEQERQRKLRQERYQEEMDAKRQQELIELNSRLMQWARKKWSAYAKKMGYSSSTINNWFTTGQWWSKFSNHAVFKQDLKNMLDRFGMTWDDIIPPNVNFQGGRNIYIHGKGVQA